MTGSELILTLNNMVRLIMGGRSGEVACMFEYPLPLYVLDMFVLIRDKSWMIRSCDDYRCALRAEGVVRIVPGHVRLEDTTGNRCLTVVRWDHLRLDDTAHSSSTARYVFRRGACYAQAQIELVEYLDVAFPHLSEKFRRIRQR